jgi:hypothetical protein
MPDVTHNGYRKSESECSTVAQAALDGDLPAQRLDQTPDQRQAQP